MANNTYDIKNCPFCGKKSQLESKESYWERKTRFFIRCTTSKCPGHPLKPVEYDSKEEALKNWNRRNDHEISSY